MGAAEALGAAEEDAAPLGAGEAEGLLIRPLALRRREAGPKSMDFARFTVGIAEEDVVDELLGVASDETGLAAPREEREWGEVTGEVGDRASVTVDG